MSFVVRLFVICAIVDQSYGAGIFEKTTVEANLHRMGNCTEVDKRYLIAYITNVKIKKVGNQDYIDYNFLINEDMPAKLSTTWILNKCRSKENPDTCIKLRSMKTGRYCELMTAQGESWSGLISCMTPPMTCPIKKGLYIGKNCSYNIGAFNMMPLKGTSYWKVSSEIFDTKTNRVLMCSSTETLIQERH